MNYRYKLMNLFCDCPAKDNRRQSHLLLRDMSKRTSEDTKIAALEILNTNNVEVEDDEEEVFDGSELDFAADETPAT